MCRDTNGSCCLESGGRCAGTALDGRMAVRADVIHTGITQPTCEAADTTVRLIFTLRQKPPIHPNTKQCPPPPPHTFVPLSTVCNISHKCRAFIFSLLVPLSDCCHDNAACTQQYSLGKMGQSGVFGLCRWRHSALWKWTQNQAKKALSDIRQENKSINPFKPRHTYNRHGHFYWKTCSGAPACIVTVFLLMDIFVLITVYVFITGQLLSDGHLLKLLVLLTMV